MWPGPVGLPTHLGKRRYSGVWPPSKPGRVPEPARAFWPRFPKPHVTPWPADTPRPFLFFFWCDPGAVFREPSVIVSSSGAGASLTFQSKTFMSTAAREALAATPREGARPPPSRPCTGRSPASMNNMAAATVWARLGSHLARENLGWEGSILTPSHTSCWTQSGVVYHGQLLGQADSVIAPT